MQAMQIGFEPSLALLAEVVFWVALGVFVAAEGLVVHASVRLLFARALPPHARLSHAVELLGVVLPLVGVGVAFGLAGAELKGREDGFRTVVQIADGAAIGMMALVLMGVGQSALWRAPSSPHAGHTPPTALATLRDYFALTKPKVVLLLLFTTFVSLFLTPAGLPPWQVVMWTLVGGYLMAGGANAMNMAYEADIDRVMGRTARRPIVAGRIAPQQAARFGFVLMTLSLAIFVLFVNALAALLALVGFLYYAVVYTRWLKRNTWQNIVIGGGAGAIPPLIGWAATSGQLELPAIFLFALIFYWTPPHFWALAVLKRREYAAANVPMLPVVAGERETTWQMLGYALGTVALSLVLMPLGVVGLPYLVGAVLLGGGLIALAWRLHRAPHPRAALGLYAYSLVYLFALFAAMLADRALRWLS